MFNDKDKDKDDRRSLFQWLLESIVMFAVGCFLIRLGVCWLVSVKLPLIVIAVSLMIGVVMVRLFIWRNRHDDY